MSSLKNNYINKTFNSLLKLFSNESFTGTTTHTISDGLGNVLPISFDSDGTTIISGTTKATKFVGGIGSISDSDGSFIGGGTSNIVVGQCSSIVGGVNNSTFREYSSVVGGENNVSNEAYSFIGGGLNNTTEGTYSGILGGQNNYTDLTNTFILGSNITATTENTTFVENINISGDIYDSNSNPGVAGQIMYRGENGLEWFTVNLNTVTGDSVSKEVFYQYTSDTNNLIGTKLNIIDFSSYSANTLNTINIFSANTTNTLNNKLNNSNFFSYTAATDIKKLDVSVFAFYTANTPTNSGTLNSAFTQTFIAYTAATKTQIDGKLSTAFTETFASYTAATKNQIDGKLSTAFTQTFASYTAATKTQIDSKVDYSTFTAYTATTNTRINSKVDTSTYNTFVSNTNSTLGTLTSGLATKVIEDGGSGSTIRINNNNQVQGPGSSVLGGCSNSSLSDYSTISGGYININNSNARCSTIVGGCLNTNSERFSFIGGGCGNSSSGNYSVIVGGCQNSVGNTGRSTIVGGTSNMTNSNYTFVGGGSSNCIGTNSDCSVISGGFQNTMLDGGSGVCLSSIGGGAYNEVCGNFSVVGGGFQNSATCQSGFIGGGTYNTLLANCAVIGGGTFNTVSGSYSTIVGGCNNKAIASYSNILGGSRNIADASNTFILGSNIATSTPDTTYVESLNISSALYDNGSSSGSAGNILSSTGAGTRWRSADNLISGSTSVTSKLSLTNFYTYTSNTNTLIGTKLNISNFNTYSSTTNTLINNKLDTTTFNSFTNSFYSYSSNTNTLIGTKLNISDFNIYSSTTNTLIGNKYDKAGGVISGKVFIQGNLFITGTANTVNQQSITITSPIIVLASGSTLPTLNAGLLINRATTGSTAFIYKEDVGEFQLGTTTALTVTNVINFKDYGKLRLGDLYTTNIYDYTNNSGLVNDVLFSTANGVQWGNLNNKLNVSDFSSYSANTKTAIDGKLNITDFNSYSSNTNTLIGTKLNITDFNSYSATTLNTINSNYWLFTSFTDSFYSYSSNTNSLINTKYDKSGGTITGNVNVVGNVSGNTFYGIGGNTMLGTPPDSSYDTGLLGLTSASTINYAVDQIDTILALLAPAKPPRLDASSWVSPGYSSAIASGDWISISGQTIQKIIFNNLLPQFRVTGGTSGTNTGFWNGLLGNVSFSVNGVSNGTKTLTTNSVNASTANTGTYLGLTLNVNDYYLNQTGKSGFWSSITASGRTQNNLSNNIFSSQTYTLTHSETGSASEVFYVDTTYTPTISNISLTTPPTITRYISGVPSLAVGDSFTYSYRVNNAVSKFYTIGNFAKMDGSLWTTNSTTYASGLLSPKPFSGQSVTLTSQILAATTNKYSESPTITFYGYNAINGVGTSTQSLTGYRIDTVSNEIRLRNAADGENNPTTPNFFPVTYTSPYTSSQSIVGNTEPGLNSSYNYELQLINGSYQVPSGNYSSYGGYDYSTPGSQTRFVLLTGGPINSASNITITFNGTTLTWTATPAGVTSGLYLNLKVGGTGWIDGNAPFPGGSDPSSNGSPAMVAAPQSTAIVKKITFGSTPRSGIIYVRIGLPAGSDKKFTGITITTP